MCTIVWDNSLFKIEFYSLRKLENKCFKIRNKSADCSKNTNLKPINSLRCVLSCGITVYLKVIFIHYVN